MKIPFVSFADTNAIIRSEILDSFQQFFDDSSYILGKNLTLFEKEYASFNHVKHAVGISNGLDALHLSLKALGIKKGDEVIVPSNTFIATVLAVSYVGATPVFVEPDETTYNIDPEKIKQAITPQTKAIIPVHLYGQACEMGSIINIAKAHNLSVIEDNAQAQGAVYNDQLTGSFGAINATSFYPGKNLGALGDGGGITTNDDALAHNVRMLRNYGSDEKYKHQVIGFNMRLDEVQAGFLSVKLKYLAQWTQQRQQIAAWYDEQLKNDSNIILPVVAKHATHVYHLYVIRSSKRDKLREYLNTKGIGTLIHYPIPPHLQLAYKDRGYLKGDFPIAERIADTCISLPVWPGMTEEKVGFICDCIKKF